MKFDKALLTHIISLLFLLTGYYLNIASLYAIGAFAISGSITNSLAIHMLFEKVPLLYGSGVIINRFADFKLGIKKLIEEEFFNKNNVNNLIASKDPHSLLNEIFAEIDLEKAFVALKKGIMESSLGGMINMIGGEAVVNKIKEPVMENLQKMLDDIVLDLKEKNHLNKVSSQFLGDIDNLVTQRLDELTPEMVKNIIQKMIKEHLGWLVVWGGIFGGLIGFIFSYYK